MIFSGSTNRIGRLFELILDCKQNEMRDRDPYWLFYAFDSHLHREGANLLNEWKRIRQVFSTLQEWFTDKRLYHMIGFLIHQGKRTKEILSWSQDVRKSEFE